MPKRFALTAVAIAIALASSGFAAAQPEAAPQADPQASTAEPERQPNNFAVWFGHVESDNIARTPIPEAGSYKETAGVFVDFGHTSSRLVANVDVDMQYRRYSSDTVDDEVVGTLNAGAEVDVIEDRFKWTFNDSHGQGMTDPYAGIGPGNREQVNVFATGPQVDLPLGARTTLELSATFSQRRFDESQTVDSDSLLSNIGVYRQLTSVSRVGLIIGSDDVEYVDVVAPDYKIDQVRVRYERQLATGRVLADVGTNEISAGGFANDGSLYDFRWSRALTARSELSVQAAQELTDAGGMLVTGLEPEFDGGSFTDILVVPSPLEGQRLVLGYRLTMSRTAISASLGSFEEDYVGTAAADNDATRLHLDFVRTITPRLALGLAYDDVEREFVDNAQPNSEDSWTSAWLYRTFGRRMFIGFGILNYDRAGTDSYGEERYEFRFGYSPTNSEVAAMASTRR